MYLCFSYKQHGIIVKMPSVRCALGYAARETLLSRIMLSLFLFIFVSMCHLQGEGWMTDVCLENLRHNRRHSEKHLSKQGM